MSSRQPLTANRLLAEFDDADLELSIPHLRPVSLNAGKILQEVEEPINQVWFPLSGMASVVVVTETGAMVEAALVGREGVLNPFLHGGWQAFNRTVVQVSGVAAAIDAARFRSIIGTSERMRDVILRYKELLLVQVQQRVACNTIHTLEQRLARWLLQAQDRVEDSSLGLTQEVLSLLLGVRRTSVTVAAMRLDALGLIRQMRGRIIIMDRAGLERAACDCYTTVRRRASAIFPEQQAPPQRGEGYYRLQR